MADTLDYAKFKVRFDAISQEINASTLISALESIVTVLEESNKNLNPKRKIRIKVQAPERGSFLIQVGLESPSLTQVLLDHLTLQNLSYLVGSLVGIFTLKKLLGKSAPQVEERDEATYNIKAPNGTVVVIDKPVFNIYKKSLRISRSLNDLFRGLTDDPSVAKVELLNDKNEQVFEAMREDFEGMTSLSEEFQTKTKIIQETQVTVSIFEQVWEEGYAWKIYYKGSKISVKITDEKFYESIHAGESFAEGDTLIVDISITQIFDEFLNIFINDSYEITRVHRHDKRGDQQNIFKE